MNIKILKWNMNTHVHMQTCKQHPKLSNVRRQSVNNLISVSHLLIYYVFHLLHRTHTKNKPLVNNFRTSSFLVISPPSIIDHKTLTPHICLQNTLLRTTTTNNFLFINFIFRFTFPTIITWTF